MAVAALSDLLYMRYVCGGFFYACVIVLKRCMMQVSYILFGRD